MSMQEKRSLNNDYQTIAYFVFSRLKLFMKLALTSVYMVRQTKIVGLKYLPLISFFFLSFFLFFKFSNVLNKREVL